MSIKQKVSDNYYEIYIEGFPETVEQRVYNGDYYSFTIVGFNYDGTPFDFGVYDTFRSQIRLGTPWNKNVLYEFPSDAFVLGKSDLNNTEQDELHVTDENALNFDKPYMNAYMDIEGEIDATGEKKTFVQIKMRINGDVTR